ncbi:hypothetical protein ITJ64_11740 [Herbiconiux sp. VKM Ac-1786]|uniref:hypothetical protein n=1 Tax=Herbiconiux sp. VKM Ac-1786 TaxID=2783824 RepID=UPI00188B12FD|nr:hypothetical protein [Herbiconiux sp. VKM Ac-1786]MBF4573190.1 hypothetical protein [Herbiconiux sp. VKM Ac-1786]
MTSEPTARQAGRGWRVWILPIGIAVGAAAVAVSLWPQPARVETVTVPLDGVATIAGHSVADTATLRTATGADYKGRGFLVTTLTVTFAGDGEPLLPGITGTLHPTSGAPVTCTSIGTQLAPADDPFTIELECSPAVTFDGLGTITGATLEQP